MKGTHRCVLPFHHMAIRPDGGIRPCCYFRLEEVPDDLNIDHSDPFNHPFLIDIRNKCRKDEYIKGCSSCYKDEIATGHSMRTFVNNPETDFGLPVKNRGIEEKLTNLDIALSNVCNNKCRMCGPELSTQWYSDAKKMGYQFNQRGIIAKNTIIESTDLTHLRFIKMLGGEPLMEQEKFISLLKKCNLKELTVLLVTNTTLVPNKELTELLLQCRKIIIQLSVDAYGPINDFLRKGSNWNTVEENIKWYRETFNTKADSSRGFPHADIGMHSVITIYNVNLVDELIEYCQKNNLYQNYVMVDGPNWIRPANIPLDVKNELIYYYENKKSAVSENRHKVYNLIINELNKEGDFGMFIRNDIRLNSIRNESWENLNPWLWNRIQKFITKDIL